MIKEELLQLTSPKWESFAPHTDDVTESAQGLDSVQYFSHDDISEMNLQIQLSEKNPAYVGSQKNEKKHETISSNNNNNNNVSSDSKPEEDETIVQVKDQEFQKIIKWQEKIFSPKEILKYGFVENPTEPLEYLYSDDARGILLDHRDDIDALMQQLTIFTYVDRDKYSVEQNTDVIRSKKASVMFIMAAFGSITDSENLEWRGEEYQLCAIRAFEDGSILIKPGFSSMPKENGSGDSLNSLNENLALAFKQINQKEDKEYYLRTRDGNVWEYKIYLYNDEPRDPLVDENRQKIINSVNQRKAKLRDNLVGHSFEKPPKGKTRFSFFGEIEKGQMFRSDNVYLQYELDINDDEIDTEFVPRTSSYSACTTVYTEEFEEGPERIAHFGLPIECHFLSKQDRSMPVVYIKVYSIDVWDSERLEGYGHFRLPRIAGHHKIEVPLWSLYHSIRGEIKTFFIGGSYDIEDSSFISRPKSIKNSPSLLNKSATRVRSSGTVTINMNCVIQDRSLVKARSTKNNSSKRRTKKKSSTTKKSTKRTKKLPKINKPSSSKDRPLT